MEEVLKIGIFFGGKSTEHDISILTAQVIMSFFKKMRLDFVPVYIGKNGQWYVSEDLSSSGSFKNIDDIRANKKIQSYSIDLSKSNGKICLTQRGLAKKELIIDLAFPAFHGPNGEDGTFQGLFELLSLPYVGCDVISSAISMDKAQTKNVCLASDIPTTKFVSFSRNDFATKGADIIQKIEKKLSFPVFVKPVHLGSSIGITKAVDRKSLKEAIEVAFFYDEKVLVEEGIEQVTDLTCAIIGNNELRTSLVQESSFQAGFFDFNEKYLNVSSEKGTDGGGIIIPAKIDQKTTKKVQELSKEIFKQLGCSGIARVDFLLDRDNSQLYLNEVNPLPGILYSHLWEKSDLKSEELISELLRLAKEKFEEKKKTETAFSSNVLEVINSNKFSSKLNVDKI